MFVGKLLGGLLGFLMAGPLGALLGLWLGHSFDNGLKLNKGTFGFAPNLGTVQNEFFITTFMVMGHIAKSDGRVSQQEIAMARQVMQALHLNEAMRLKAMHAFNDGKAPDFDLQQCLQHFLQHRARHHQCSA